MLTFFHVLMAMILVAPACYGQAVAVAEVQGQVLDGSGSAVPGAQVKMIQTETDYVRNTTAGGGGAHRLPNPPRGPYMLERKAEGFTSPLQSGGVPQVVCSAHTHSPLQDGSRTG